MNTTTALIADDEEAPRAQIAAALRSTWPSLDIVAECANGADAWDAFLEHEPQVCFLDVRMPGLSGLEVAQRIAGRAHVVFVTAYGDHALAAFDAGAVDYVLKPVEPVRLAQAVQRVRSRLASPPADLRDVLRDKLSELMAGLRKPPPLEVIQASVGREVRLIRSEEIVYLESDTRYTRIVHPGGDALIRTPLKELLTRLDPALFWQVHRSVIVNHRHIAAAVRIDESSMHLTLRDRSETLPVSRHFQTLFRGQ